MSYTRAINWFKNNFAEQVNKAIENTPYTLDLVTAIACKETSIKWLNWIDKYDTETILQRCVFDASGDMKGTFRNAFPRNKYEFEQKFGTAITEALIFEANLSRIMPQPGYPKGYKPADYLYKGYGIFQYDLQNILTDEIFFTNKLWYNFDECLIRLIKILDEKRKVLKYSNLNTLDLHEIIKHYNGNGSKAENYAHEVSAIMKISQTIV